MSPYKRYFSLSDIFVTLCNIFVTFMTFCNRLFQGHCPTLFYAKSLESKDIISVLVFGFALIFLLLPYLILTACSHSKRNSLWYYILLLICFLSAGQACLGVSYLTAWFVTRDVIMTMDLHRNSLILRKEPISLRI